MNNKTASLNGDQVVLLLGICAEYGISLLTHERISAEEECEDLAYSDPVTDYEKEVEARCKVLDTLEDILKLANTIRDQKLEDVI